ncbi:hypothetical protein J437_LFUL012792 [Ladona fulva]|uniref:DUF4371 domain-containing protein n=1 Tax=Ladona fulva TaxID=123851 RepID=A0A8K0KG59_LADFU|nr:hypothetical protein J437_LFUL012792 [Ladona fulva]
MDSLTRRTEDRMRIISWECTSGNRVEVRRGKGGGQTLGWPGQGFRKHRGYGASVAFAKKHNEERHFQTNHGTFATNYPENSEIRKKKVCELESKLSAQQSVFVRPLSKSRNATTASFKIAYLLAKKKKPFQDGELLKEAFLACAESLFRGFSNKREIISAIQELQLSDSIVLRRIEAIADDMQSQLKRDVETCDWFSLQFDESTDNSDTSQLAVIIRMLFNDFTVKEELLKILPLKERARGENIYNVFKIHAAEIGLPLKKLSVITTDGAPAMIGRTNSFGKSLVHFPNMKKMTNDGNSEPSRFTGHLKKLLNQFEKRFQLPGVIRDGFLSTHSPLSNCNCHSNCKNYCLRSGKPRTGNT